MTDTTRKECEHCTVVKSYADAKVKIDALVEALVEFSDHDDDCHVKRGIYYDKPCSCGYDEKVGALLASHTPQEAKDDNT